eukprot:1345402-Pyramimonas_sp.AAC.1
MASKSAGMSSARKCSSAPRALTSQDDGGLTDRRVSCTVPRPQRSASSPPDDPAQASTLEWDHRLIDDAGLDEDALPPAFNSLCGENDKVQWSV